MTASTRQRRHDTANHRSGSGSDGGNGNGFQRRPLALICKGCHGQYFAASLAIHQKSCFERHPFVDIACPQCRVVVQSGKFRDHAASCEGPPRTLETATQRVTKPDASTEELNPPDPDGRVRCRQCDRAFHTERIAKHQSVCVGSRRRMPEPQNVRPPLTIPKPTRENLVKTTSPTRRASYVTRMRGVSAVSLEFSTSSSRANTHNPTWGREREVKRFDIVHRDGGARHVDSSTGGGCPASLSLSMSTATSTSNPLATTRLMTVHSW